MATIIVRPGESIQAAIDRASNGDTIRLEAGTYRESLVLNKSVTLLGAGSSTVLTAGAGNNAITLAQGSSGSTIRNFSIQDSRAGVITIPGAPVSNITIEQMRLSRLERYAVLISYGANNFRVVNNSIDQVNVGVQLLTQAAGQLDNITVSGNTIRDVSGIALYLNALINEPGGSGAITFRNNQITQDIQKIGNNLSLVTLQFARSASHKQVRIQDNIITFTGQNSAANRGLYGVRVAGNANQVDVINNRVINDVRGNPISSGGIWIDTEDALYGKIPGTAQLKFNGNTFTRLNAPIFYDGILSPGIRFDLRNNVYPAFVGSTLGDFVGGTSRADRVTGKVSNDILSGAGGSDHLFGEQGNDSLLGGSSNDALDGGQGRDQLAGGLGQDVLTGGLGNDLFTFESLISGIDTITDFKPGADTIELQNIIQAAALSTPTKFSGFIQFKTIGRATQVLVDANGVRGGAQFRPLIRLEGVTTDKPTAADFVFNVRGSTGNDSLIGGAENNFFIGDLGNDTLTGGAGRDQFIFLRSDITAVGDSTDIITDFDPTIDLINLRSVLQGVEYQSLNPFTDYVQLAQDGANTLVQVTPEGDVATKTFKTLAVLQGVTAGAITADAFTFY